MDIAASAIEAALRQLPDLPSPVASWHVETGPDSTDDLAIRFTIRTRTPCHLRSPRRTSIPCSFLHMQHRSHVAVEAPTAAR